MLSAVAEAGPPSPEVREEAQRLYRKRKEMEEKAAFDLVRYQEFLELVERAKAYRKVNGGLLEVGFDKNSGFFNYKAQVVVHTKTDHDDRFWDDAFKRFRNFSITPEKGGFICISIFEDFLIFNRPALPDEVTQPKP